jgi:hypothetical protein
LPECGVISEGITLPLFGGWGGASTIAHQQLPGIQPTTPKPDSKEYRKIIAWLRWEMGATQASRPLGGVGAVCEMSKSTSHTSRFKRSAMMCGTRLRLRINHAVLRHNLAYPDMRLKPTHPSCLRPESFKLLLFMFASAMMCVAVVSCDDRNAKLSEQFAPTTGLLDRGEILERLETGALIGISSEELIKLCGVSRNTDKYPEFEYKTVIGVCDGYAPDKQWLLVHLEGGRVVQAKIDCD